MSPTQVPLLDLKIFQRRERAKVIVAVPLSLKADGAPHP
jgi:hypothetical protein